jgi:hypothetical protein
VAKKKNEQTPQPPVNGNRSLPPNSLFGTAMLRRGEAGPPLPGAREVNERCMDMLVHAARQERRSFALVAELRDQFVLTTPLTRRRVADRAFLLVDMHFRDHEWWDCAVNRAAGAMRNPPWHGSFPRLSGAHLVRATLILAWNGLRTDPATSCVLFGMAPAVAKIIATLRFDDIDRIAQKHFGHVRPRWDDRPAVWRKLLLAAQLDEENAMGDFNVHGLQLLAGELLAGFPKRASSPEPTAKRVESAR